MLLALVLALGCQRPAPPAASVSVADTPPAVAWRSPLGHDHPWLGRIWSVEQGAWIDEDHLTDELRRVDVVLLGEKHDNPDHHLLQARLVGALAQPGTGVLFEQLDMDDPVHGATDPASLAEAVAWDQSGWPDFAIYEPVFAAVYARGARVLPAHPTRAQLQTVMARGMDALPPDLLESLPDEPLSEEQLLALQQEIVNAHCGMFDAEKAWPLVHAQIFKDAHMAAAVEQAGFPAILVAGGGHTRPDRGVPHHLDANTATVLFREVHDTQVGTPSLDGEADYVWFTARVDDEDPCERFREQLRQMRFR